MPVKDNVPKPVSLHAAIGGFLRHIDDIKEDKTLKYDEKTKEIAKIREKINGLSLDLQKGKGWS